MNRNTHSAAPVALLAFASSRAALVSILLSLISAAALAGPSPPRFRHDPDGAAPNGQSVVDAARSDFQRIAILPDRTTGMDWGLRYLTQAVADLNRLRPDAVFTIGDMVQGYHRDEAEWTRQATQYLEIVSPLVMPFFPVPGNHDVISGTRRDGDATFAELYRRAFGPLWYSVDLERLTVIVLFSDDGVGVRPQLIRDEQLAWLSGALDAASTRGKPIVVLMHRPLWRASVEHWNEKIRPLLEKASVRAVIAGHFHSMQRDETIGGVDYHILGTCGGSIDQHPYAGQMQHLTFLDVPAEGALRLFHMPVGVTLPEDWILRADQDRVYKLLSDRDAVKWEQALPDPYLASAATVKQIGLLFRNPLDVPVEVSIRQMVEEPGPWLVGRENWVSWTPVDIFNPHVTALAGPFNITSVEKVAVPAGETVRIPLTVRSTPEIMLRQPPPLEMTVRLRDGQDRDVPIRIPLRVPLQRTILAPPSLELSASIPICVWNPSPYDRFEADPACRLAIANGPDHDELLIEVATNDAWMSGHAEEGAGDANRRANPAADAIRVEILAGGGTHEWLIEPFNGNAVIGDACTPEKPVVRPDGAGWTQRIRIPWPGGRFASSTGQGGRINIGVADNDETYHTQWRWLAPREYPAVLRLGDPPLMPTEPERRPRRRADAVETPAQ